MTASNLRHELDDKLADATMFAWYGPMFRLAFKHWLFSLMLGIAAFGLGWCLDLVPWPYLGSQWWVQLLSGYVEFVAYSVLVIVAYRFLVQRENVGIVSDWPTTLIRAVQIQTIWFAVICAIVAAIALLASLFGHFGRAGNLNTLLVQARLSLVLTIGVVLMMPVWFSVLVATALSDVYAVRSSETAFGAVRASLRLAFGQKWRVFWPSYVLFVLAIVVYAVVIPLMDYLPFSTRLLFITLTTFAATVFGVPMTFVIERAYAAHLTMPDVEAGATLALQPSHGIVSTPRVRKQSAPAAPLPSAPDEIADRLAEDLRSNRMKLVVEMVEHGLKADAEFFVRHPDQNLAVAKRLAAVQRPDLALRMAEPYLKNHRGHRQHLTMALYVANLLLRDLGRKTDAERFLGQVKVLYPNEPMVDQLIKITDKAIAEG